MKAPHGKSTPSLVWNAWVFCKWRYHVFNLSRVPSKDHFKKESCDFLIYSFLRYVTIMASLMTVSIVVVEIWRFWFVTWPQMITVLKVHVRLLVEGSHGKSPTCNVWWPYRIFSSSRNFTKLIDWRINYYFISLLYYFLDYFISVGSSLCDTILSS